jgi:phospholipid/cholesterol/gamma-HCH transport system permease protein
LASTELTLNLSKDGVLLLQLIGSWRISEELPPAVRVREELEARGRVSRVAFDPSGVTDWDSGLLTFLRRVTQDCSARQVEMDRSGLPTGVQQLLKLTPHTTLAPGVGSR